MEPIVITFSGGDVTGWIGLFVYFCVIVFGIQSLANFCTEKVCGLAKWIGEKI